MVVKAALPALELQNHLKTEDCEEENDCKSRKRKHSDVEECCDVGEITSSSIDKKEIMKCVAALQILVENDENVKKNLFHLEKPPIFLVITCVKIPKVPLHQMRIVLPHSLVSSNDDVALFVKDLKRGRRVDYENTVTHYKNILEQHGCKQVKSIIPINQVKTEYRQFEMRRRLLNSYDYFLVDGRISGHMVHLLGKSFREKRKLPTSIHMDKIDLNSEINYALKKTSLQVHGTGDSSVTQVGSFYMDIENVADNILAVVEQLKKDFPGGWDNIRSLRIKTPLSLSIPIYITLKSRNDVEVPRILPKRPKAYKNVEGELSTYVSNVKVIVSPGGAVSAVKIGTDGTTKNLHNDNNKVKKVKKNAKLKSKKDKKNSKVKGKSILKKKQKKLKQKLK